MKKTKKKKKSECAFFFFINAQEQVEEDGGEVELRGDKVEVDLPRAVRLEHTRNGIGGESISGCGQV